MPMISPLSIWDISPFVVSDVAQKNAPTAPALRRVADQVNWARSSKGGGAVAAAILIG